jgi:glycerophosphoryl diester phosphodiesterase
MPTVIAHRGASAHAPEHTVVAYDRALADGADWLELDVRRLADGTPVVVHDRTLSRTCGDPRAVADLLPRDLRDIPGGPLTLAEVLARYGDRARYLVELKDPSTDDGPLVLDVATVLGVRDRVAVQSFGHGALKRLRGRDVPLWALYPVKVPSRWLRMDLGRVAGWAAGIAPHAASVDAALVAAAHDRGLAVRAYTVNDPAEMERLLAAGVDGLITDAPDLARGVVAGVPLAA